jgi:hypothetical protein
MNIWYQNYLKHGYDILMDSFIILFILITIIYIINPKNIQDIDYVNIKV